MKIRIPSVAYHEAGHAVVAFVLGMDVELVSIETQGFPPGWLLRGGVLASFNLEGYGEPGRGAEGGDRGARGRAGGAIVVQAKAVASRKKHATRQVLWRPHLRRGDASPLYQRFCRRTPHNQAPERNRPDLAGDPLEFRRSAGRKTCEAQSGQRQGHETAGHFEKINLH